MCRCHNKTLYTATFDRATINAINRSTITTVTLSTTTVAPLPGKVMGVSVTPSVMNLSPFLTVTWYDLAYYVHMSFSASHSLPAYVKTRILVFLIIQHPKM